MLLRRLKTHRFHWPGCNYQLLRGSIKMSLSSTISSQFPGRQDSRTWPAAISAMTKLKSKNTHKSCSVASQLSRSRLIDENRYRFKPIDEFRHPWWRVLPHDLRRGWCKTIARRPLHWLCLRPSHQSSQAVSHLLTSLSPGSSSLRFSDTLEHEIC